MNHKKIKFKNIDYRKPIIGFHARNKTYGRENSIESFSKAMDYKPEMIEIDIRCSRDEIIYCYHGIEPFCRIWRFFKFSTIKKFTKANRLEDVLSVINKKGKPLILLDIKQGLLPIELVDKICQNFDFDYIWCFIFYYNLYRTKKKFKNRINYFYECFPFINIYPFKFNFLRAKKSGANVFNLSYNQFNQKNIDLIHKEGMVYNIYDIYFGYVSINKNKIRYLTKKYGRPYILLDNLEDPEIKEFRLDW